MPYLAYAGAGAPQVADDLRHAIELAGLHLESADDFARKMGWVPFWAESVAVLSVPVKVWDDPRIGLWKALDHAKVARTAAQIRKSLGMAPCPAARP